jgi:hypothetical protein
LFNRCTCCSAILTETASSLLYRSQSLRRRWVKLELTCTLSLSDSPGRRIGVKVWERKCVEFLPDQKWILNCRKSSRSRKRALRVTRKGPFISSLSTQLGNLNRHNSPSFLKLANSNAGDRQTIHQANEKESPLTKDDEETISSTPVFTPIPSTRTAFQIPLSVIRTGRGVVKAAAIRSRIPPTLRLRLTPNSSGCWNVCRLELQSSCWTGLRQRRRI